jgi:hypothetical protein
MSNTPQKSLVQNPVLKKPAGKPNEKGNITVQAHFKIFDPQSKKVYVEGRA